LTLTAEEAVKKYGTPPQPLLGTGIYESVEKLLDEKCGPGHYTLIKMEINWAEKVGLWLNSIGPIIIGIGLLGLFIEFKTPGFGFFGIAGIVFVLIFFGSKYVSGLAGQEEVLVFLLGVSLGYCRIIFVSRLSVSSDYWSIPYCRFNPLGHGGYLAKH
jgi:membrane-bound serine protease (ClpP class)